MIINHDLDWLFQALLGVILGWSLTKAIIGPQAERLAALQIATIATVGIVISRALA